MKKKRELFGPKFRKLEGYVFHTYKMHFISE